MMQLMRAGIFILLGTLLALAQSGCSSATASKHQESRRKKDRGTHELLQERYDSASKLLQIERRKREIGKSTLDAVILAAVRLRDARLELAAEPETTTRTKHLEFMRELEEEANKMVGFAEGYEAISETARYWRLTAEIELIRAQATITVH